MEGHRAKFKASVRKRIQLLRRDLQDGCVNCMAKGALCFEHRQVMRNVILSPKDHLAAAERMVTAQ